MQAYSLDLRERKIKHYQQGQSKSAIARMIMGIRGQLLSTWYALDALFLPILLDQMAELIDHCPVTQAPIHLTVAPHAIEQYQPQSIVVSIVTPQARMENLASAEDIWMVFCNYVHFFSSAAASTWFSEKQQPAHFVSVEEAFQSGKALFGKLVDHVKAG